MAPTRPDSFYALGVRPLLAQALAERGITEPFPIQAESLPDSLAGRDVLGRGRTGSGKTVAFALPVIERVLAAGSRAPRRPKALILVPTRELAVQVQETVEYLARAARLRTMTVYGGVKYGGQLRRLERGVDIVVATPGRLEDLIEQRALQLDDVGVVVLDEADLMADMGFLPPVTRVLQACPPGQRMLFSATLDDEVAKLVSRFLHDPLVHAVEDADSGPDAEHYLFLVRHDNKPAIVTELLAGGGRALAFTRTKFAAERLANSLTEAGIPAVELHGNLRQAARQSNLSAFADGRVAVLVATDIAARGIHVNDVGLVLHVDPPADHKAFLHRSGRTARAGAEGNVVTLATKNQNKNVRALMGLAKIKPTQAVVKPGDEILARVRATRVEPAQAGTSIFEPDPEDILDDPTDAPRPERRGGERSRHADERGRGGQRERRDERAQRPARSDARGWEAPVEYRPRREPKAHTSGGRGARPEYTDSRPRRDGRGEARGDHAVRRGEWGKDFWGPEPWETDEQPTRRRDSRWEDRTPPTRSSRSQAGPAGAQARSQRPASKRWESDSRSSRPASRPWESDSRSARPSRPWESDSRSPRPSRDARAGESELRAKNRWTADDRRKAAESREQGFGFKKASSDGPAQDKRKGKGKGGKPGKPVRDKDKGKPKRFSG